MAAWPGAIGAWRVEAVREAGGFHTDTVAEDADLTMALLQLGYRVEYEDWPWLTRKRRSMPTG